MSLSSVKGRSTAPQFLPAGPMVMWGLCTQSFNFSKSRLEISSRKLRDTKGAFPAKMGILKDRNGMGLTEAEDIKKRWQEYTEEH